MCRRRRSLAKEWKIEWEHGDYAPNGGNSRESSVKVWWVSQCSNRSSQRWWEEQPPRNGGGASENTAKTTDV